MGHPKQPASSVARTDSPYRDRQRQMVDRQLRARGITDQRVLEAMSEVPREEFVAEQQRDAAYDDGPLAIGYGQTISQPYTVAFMCEALKLTGSERMLEVGAGSGYAAAVLSHLARFVYSVERIPELAEQAQVRLKRLGYENVEIHIADGTRGLPERGPFDGIVVTAGAESLPGAYREQLADGGRIVIPIGSAPRMQTMRRFTRRGEQFTSEDLGGFAFVPLIGKYGWNEEDVERISC